MYLTKAEISKRWKVSGRFVEKLSAERLPKFDISGGARRKTYRYNLKDVEAYETKYTIGNIPTEASA
ncbi:MAG: hypothetical protein HGA69_00405 [Desulfobulbaceae bacterium]|nr:hypothetical protein [Desulfobulbaceae bacterium]